MRQLFLSLNDIAGRLPKGVRLEAFLGGGNTNTVMIALETYPAYEDGKRNINVLEISNSSSVEAMEKLIMDKAQEVLAYRG